MNVRAWGRRLFSYLFLGTLSLFFAEVLSGASQVWFLDLWSLLVTFPLYLFHLLFFLSLAIKTGKTSLAQLYLFGMLFALYESWVTKVLWAGYMGADGPGMGTVAGLATGEFVILVLFWHPVMSFIVPIVVYQALSGNVLSRHARVLAPSPWRRYVLVLFSLCIGSFVVNGNQFNLVSIGASVGGTLALAFLFHRLSDDSDVVSLAFSGNGFYVISAYLVVLYLVTFESLLPENVPGEPLPFLSILFVYASAIALLGLTKRRRPTLVETDTDAPGRRTLLLFGVTVAVSASVLSFVPGVSWPLFIVTYLVLSGVGVVLAILVLVTVLRGRAAIRGIPTQRG